MVFVTGEQTIALREHIKSFKHRIGFADIRRDGNNTLVTQKGGKYEYPNTSTKLSTSTNEPVYLNIPIQSQPLISVSCLNSNTTLVRFMANDAEAAYQLLSRLLSPLQEHLGFDPYSDRLHGNSSMT